MNFQKYLDTTYWFIQPPSVLTFFDKFTGYASAALALVGILFWIWARFMPTPVHKKLINKFANFAFTIGIFGLLWFGMRYEYTPIFSDRIWPLLIGLGGIVWFVIVAKYALTGFRRERTEWANQQVKEKYLPKKR